MENKINFLNSAISDAQELIRFIDTKTAIVVTILGSYIIAFFTSIDKIIAYKSEYSFWFWMSLILFFLLLICCIGITTRIIKPTNNPVDNLDLDNIQIPKLKYYLPTNNYQNDYLYSFKNSKKYKLSENFKSYYQTIKNDTEDKDIIKALSFELLKVSYIRNIKNDRFNTLLLFLLFTTFTFILSYILFSIETNLIIEKLNNIKTTCCK